MHRPTDNEIETMIRQCERAVCHQLRPRDAMDAYAAIVAELRRLRALESLAGQALVAKFHAARANPYTFDGRPICRPL
jgi:hypothetical protein